MGIICFALIASLSGCQTSSKKDEAEKNAEVASADQTAENTEKTSEETEDAKENGFIFPNINQSKETNIFPPVLPESKSDDEMEVELENSDETDEPNPEKPSKPSKPSRQDEHAAPPRQNDPKPSSPASDEDSVTKKYKSDISKIAAGAQNYYNDYFSSNKLISKNGKLYNYSTSQEVSPSYLSRMGYINDSLSSYDCSVLLLKPSHVNAYGELSSSGASENLSIYTAFKNPNSDSYMMFSGSGYIGSLSSSKYTDLVSKYIQTHGPVQRIYRGESAEYDRILNFVRMSEGVYEDYWVRCIYADDMYAIVVLSPKSNPSDVRQYLLKKNASYWEVAMSGLETEARVVTAINKKYPDFNPNLLPNYTINDYRGSLKNSYNGAISSFITNGFIESSDNLNYLCGAGSYCYATTYGSKHLLATLSGDTWNSIEYSSSWEAKQAIEARGSTTPTFIVYDE